MPKTATLVSMGALLLASTALAQDVLPQPEQPFKGTIGRTAKDSTPDFPKGVEAPQGAPERPSHHDGRRWASERAAHSAARFQTPNFQRLADSRTPLQHVPHHCTLFADSCGAHYRA